MIAFVSTFHVQFYLFSRVFDDPMTTAYTKFLKTGMAKAETAMQTQGA